MAKKLRDEDLVLNIIVNGDKGRKEMGKLEQAIKDTNSEIRTLQKEQKRLADEGQKESEAYKSLTAAIKEKNNAITVAESRLAQLRNGMKLTEMTITDLRKEQKKLTMLLNTSVPGSDNWNKYKNELAGVTNRINELSDKGKETGINLRSMANSFNHYIGIISAGILTITGIVAGIKKITGTFAEFDDKIADVQKTTGLAKSDVRELNDELKKIDTRTQQADLLGLAKVAGKLGFTAKEDIAGFVKATDQISVSLTEDLGGDVEESINQIGKLVDIFKLKDKFGIEQSILKVGSAINDLGANSTANEGYLVEFTKRMAGIAPLAGTSIQQMLGLGATLDQFGQTAEVSSSALSKLFVKMASDAKKFAKYAGMDVTAFKDLMQKDFMAAFIKVLQGVKSSAGGINELAASLGDLGIDGGRVVGVLGTLANNTDVLKTQLDLANRSFAQGTSITKEYIIKNQTAAASLERAQKAVYNMTVDLGEKLQPALVVTTSGFVTLVKILTVLIGFIIDNRKAIIILLSSVVAYNTALLFTNFLSTAYSKNLQAEILWKKVSDFWNKAMTGSMHLLSAAYALLTGNIEVAKAEMVLFNTVTKMNPLAILISVLAAAGVAIYLFTRKLTDAEKAQRLLNDVNLEAQKTISEEKAKIEALQAIIASEVATRAEKLKAIKDLRELLPDHLKAYTDEQILAGQATEAINTYIDAQLRRARIDASINKLADMENKKSELQGKLDGGYSTSTIGERISAGFSATGGKSTAEAYNESLKSQIAEIDKNQEVLRGKLQGDLKASGKEGTSSALQEKADELTKYLRNLKKGTDDYKKTLKEIQTLNTVVAVKKDQEAHPEKYKDATTGVTGETEAEKKAREKAEKQRESDAKKATDTFENLNKEISKLGLDRLNDQMSKNDKEVAQDGQKYDALIQKLQDFKKQKGASQAQIAKADEDIAKLETEKSGKAAEIRKRQEEELTAKIKQLRESLSKKILTEVEKEKQIINSFYDERVKEAGANAQEIERIEKNRREDLATADLNEKKRLEEEKKKIEDQYQQIKGATESQKIAKINAQYNAEIEALKQKFSAEMQLTQDFQDALKAIEINRDAEVHEIKRQKVLEQKDLAIGATQQISDAVFTITNNNRNRETEIELQNLNQKRDAELSNKNLTEAQKASINAKYDKQEKAIKLKQWKSDKQAALTQAIINGALAVVKALPNIPLSIAAGIAAAAEIAVIADSKPPAELTGKEEGGFLNVTRKQDGKRFKAKNRPSQRGYVDKPTVIVGEGKDPEFVVNGDAVKNPTIKPFLDIIDIAQRNGTINAVDLTQYIDKPTPISVLGRESGGYTKPIAPEQSFKSTEKTESQVILSKAVEVIEKFSKQLDQGITAEVALLGKKGFLQANEDLKMQTNNGNL
nr:phage tail tape measure protein [uncultured Pedobacter sp.]